MEAEDVQKSRLQLARETRIHSEAARLALREGFAVSPCPVHPEGRVGCTDMSTSLAERIRGSFPREGCACARAQVGGRGGKAEQEGWRKVGALFYTQDSPAGHLQRALPADGKLYEISKSLNTGVLLNVSRLKWLYRLKSNEICCQDSDASRVTRSEKLR